MTFYNLLIEKHAAAFSQLKCIGCFLLMLTGIVLPVCFIQMNIWTLGSVLFLSGWVSWTFIEYIIHRFWMHDKESVDESPIAQRHHHHHTHPTDIKITGAQRLLLSAIVIAAVIFSVLFMIYFMIVAGLISGFAGYTMMHWILHQRWSVKIFPRLHRYHIYHHCKFPNTCYGISVPWWDLLFKTVPPTEPVLLKRVIDFYFDQTPKNNMQRATGKSS